MPLLVVFACFAYAATRYVVFGDVAIDQLPAFIGNKAIAFAVAVLLMLSAIKQNQNDIASAANFGRWAWHLLIMHCILSLALFSQAHYPKFFNQGLSNLNGQLLLLAGALGAYGFYRLQSLKDSIQLKGLCALLLAAHLLPMSSSWLSPVSWPGYMVPVSLLSFIAATVAFGLFSLQRR